MGGRRPAFARLTEILYRRVEDEPPPGFLSGSTPPDTRRMHHPGALLCSLDCCGTRCIRSGATPPGCRAGRAGALRYSLDSRGVSSIPRAGAGPRLLVRQRGASRFRGSSIASSVRASFNPLDSCGIWFATYPRCHALGCWPDQCGHVLDGSAARGHSRACIGLSFHAGIRVGPLDCSGIGVGASEEADTPPGGALPRARLHGIDRVRLRPQFANRVLGCASVAAPGPGDHAKESHVHTIDAPYVTGPVDPLRGSAGFPLPQRGPPVPQG